LGKGQEKRRGGIDFLGGKKKKKIGLGGESYLGGGGESFEEKTTFQESTEPGILEPSGGKKTPITRKNKTDWCKPCPISMPGGEKSYALEARKGLGEEKKKRGKPIAGDFYPNREKEGYNCTSYNVGYSSWKMGALSGWTSEKEMEKKGTAGPKQGVLQYYCDRPTKRPRHDGGIGEAIWGDMAKKRGVRDVLPPQTRKENVCGTGLAEKGKEVPGRGAQD